MNNALRTTCGLFVGALLAAAVAATLYAGLAQKPVLASPQQIAIVSHTDYDKPVTTVGPVRLSPEAQVFYNQSASKLRDGFNQAQPEAGKATRLNVFDLHGGR